MNKKTQYGLLGLFAFAVGCWLVYPAAANYIGDFQKAGVHVDEGRFNTESFSIYETSVVDYTTTGTAKTLTAANSGGAWFVSSSSDDPVTFNLPAAEKGLMFTFIDNDATAAADLTIDPATGDKINNQTAGVSYNATGDAFGETVTLLAIDDTNWIVVSKVGTWTTGS